MYDDVLIMITFGNVIIQRISSGFELMWTSMESMNYDLWRVSQWGMILAFNVNVFGILYFFGQTSRHGWAKERKILEKQT